jgi:hypothetical protein
MKKLFTLSALVLSSVTAFAQLPVSTASAPKNAVLEEFTGVNCVFCPDGHKIAAQIVAANPGRVYAVNIHTGGFATPAAGQLDLRTNDGNAIAAIPSMGITGYPQGAVSRAFYPTTATAYALNRGSWTAATAARLAQPSYVNVAGQASLNVATRELTVNIEAYYTANSPAATNKLTVMLLQNNINGSQVGAAQYNPTMVNPDGTYRHMHALRDIITTSATGDDITTTTQGSLYTRTITYAVPAIIGNVPVDLSNLEIVAFIHEGVPNIITANEVPIAYTGFTTVNNLEVASVNSIEPLCVNTFSPKVRISNNGSATITTADISYSVNGGTPSVYNFTGSIAPLASQDITLPAIGFTLAASNNLDVNITAVNGGTDDDPADNTGTTSFLASTSVSQSVNLTLKVTQDRYGSETTWKFSDDNGVVLASGGPYADLAANGTLLNTHNVVVPATGCYRFELLDSYGDGINSGYGVGNAIVLDGYGNTVYSTNGVFTFAATRNFDVANNVNTTSVAENNFVSSLNIYPNPASSAANLVFDLTEAKEVSVMVLNNLGQSVINNNLGRLTAGNHKHAIDCSVLPSGLYFAKITTGTGASFVKFTVNN